MRKQHFYFPARYGKCLPPCSMCQYRSLRNSDLLFSADSLCSSPHTCSIWDVTNSSCSSRTISWRENHHLNHPHYHHKNNLKPAYSHTLCGRKGACTDFGARALNTAATGAFKRPPSHTFLFEPKKLHNKKRYHLNYGTHILTHAHARTHAHHKYAQAPHVPCWHYTRFIIIWTQNYMDNKKSEEKKRKEEEEEKKRKENKGKGVRVGVCVLTRRSAVSTCYAVCVCVCVPNYQCISAGESMHNAVERYSMD